MSREFSLDLDMLVVVYGEHSWWDLLQVVWQFCLEYPAEQDEALDYLRTHPDESARGVARVIREGPRESLYCPRCGSTRCCLLVQDPPSDLPSRNCPVPGWNHWLRWPRRERLCLTCVGRFATAEVDEDLITHHVGLRASLEQLQQVLDGLKQEPTVPAWALSMLQPLLAPLNELKALEESYRSHSVLVESLDLSIRLQNIMDVEGIDTLKQLCALKAEELLAFRAMDSAKVGELRTKLAARGLKLRGE